MVHILIPSIGVPATRGTLHMLRHNADKEGVRITGVDCNDKIVARHWIESFHPAPRRDDPHYTRWIVDLCKEEGVDCILVQTDQDAQLLGKQKEIPVASNGRAPDKGEVLTLFRDLSLPCPDYQVIANVKELYIEAEALGYPRRKLVVKPLRSWGGRGMELLTDAYEPNGEPLLIMEHLPGDEYTVDAFIGEKAEIAIPRLRRSVMGGTAFESELDYRVDLTEWTLEAGRQLGLRYLFGMQYKLDAAGVPKILECNPRIQGTTIATLFSGVNLVWMAVKEALGDPSPQPSQPLKRATFTRTWGGIAEGDGWYVEV